MCLWNLRDDCSVCVGLGGGGGGGICVLTAVCRSGESRRDSVL